MIRRFCWTLPLLLACGSVVLMSGGLDEAMRYLLWSTAWWVLGWFAVGAVGSLNRTPMSRLAFGGLAGVLGQLLAWFICVGCGVPTLMPLTPFVMACLLAAVPQVRRAMMPRVWSHSSAMSAAAPPSGLKTPAAKHTVPTYALAAWTTTSSYLLVAFYATTRAQPLPPGVATLYQDLFWHAGIAAELKHRVVPQVIEAKTGQLNYHWLSDAYMAAGSLGSGVPTITVAARLWVVPIILLATALLVVVAQEITRSWFSAWPATLIVTFGSSVSLLPWQALGPSTTFAFLSPSQVFGVPMTLGALDVVARVWRAQRLSWRGAVGMWALFVACTGSKSSIVPVFIGGTVISMLWTLWTLMSGSKPGRALLRVRAMTLAALCAALVVAVPFFAGGSAGSRIRVFGHLRRLDVVARTTGHAYELNHGPFFPSGMTLLAGFILVVLVVALYASYALAWTPLFTLGRTTLRVDPLPVLLMGSMASAAGAFLLIDHTGQSESYFPMGAMPLLAIAAGWSFSTVGERATNRRWRDVLYGLGVGGALIVVMKLSPHSLPREPLNAHGVEKAPYLLWWFLLPLSVVLAFVALAALWGSRRSTLLAPLVALAVFGASGPGWSTLTQTFNGITHGPDHTFAWSVRPGESAALAWLRHNTPVNTLVATNVHCADVAREPHCDASAYWTSALSERQMLIGGWGYTDAAQRRSGVDGFPATQQNFPDAATFSLNESAFYRPTKHVTEQLKNKGVTYLYADSRVAPLSPQLRDVAQLVGTWGTASVYRLR